MKTGHIRIIDNVVFFEPDGLKKPMKKDHLIMYDGISFSELMQEYEASKQLVEVSNVIRMHLHIYVFSDIGGDVKNNQPCKAEVTGKTATIIELTKE